MRMQRVFIFSALFLVIDARRSCPDLASLRSEAVSLDLNTSRASGIWFEWAYHDVAQSGSRCQTFNNNIDPEGFFQDFSVLYGDKPFRQTYRYNASDETAQSSGLFTKYLAAGASLFVIPTVFVYVIGDSSEIYQLLTEYSCVDIFGVRARRFAPFLFTM